MLGFGFRGGCVATTLDPSREDLPRPPCFNIPRALDKVSQKERKER